MREFAPMQLMFVYRNPFIPFEFCNICEPFLVEIIRIYHIHKYKVPFHVLGSGYYDSINREHKINDALRVIAFLFHI